MSKSPLLLIHETVILQYDQPKTNDKILSENSPKITH